MFSTASFSATEGSYAPFAQTNLVPKVEADDPFRHAILALVYHHVLVCESGPRLLVGDDHDVAVVRRAAILDIHRLKPAPYGPSPRLENRVSNSNRSSHIIAGLVAARGCSTRRTHHDLFCVVGAHPLPTRVRHAREWGVQTIEMPVQGTMVARHDLPPRSLRVGRE